MKQKLFFLSLVIIPLLLIVCVEIFLVAINYGSSYKLFLDDGINYRTNQNYAQKYFTSNDIAIPQLLEQNFRKEKVKNGIRIVCLGGSTTAGFPFEININFPYFIRRYLETSHPDKSIELINLGISAVNSHAVLDMCPDIEAIKPDIILIYMGHNEFYGAMGLASNEFIGNKRWLIKLVLNLRELRLYQLLENSIGKIAFNLNSKEKSKQSETLMKALIGQNQIQPDDIIRKKTYDNFKANLDEILHFWNGKNIPVIISDLVSNLKDQPPLGPSIALDQISRQVFENFETFYANQEWHQGIGLLHELINSNPKNAQLHYYFGNCFFQLKQNEKALEHLKLARDFDPAPFRAPSEINKIIKQLTNSSNALFVSAESLFSTISPNRITDNSLFLEHLHPNPTGNELLSKVFIQPLIKIIEDRSIAISDINLFRDYTSLDIAIGELKILDLIKQPPFSKNIRFEPTQMDDPKILELAKAHVYKNLFWDEAHLKLGQYYQKKSALDKALKEYAAVLSYNHRHVPALVKSGDIMFLSKTWDKAEAYYKTAINNAKEVDYIQAKLGKLYIVSEQNKLGINILQDLLYSDRLNTEEVIANKKELHYLLAIGFARQKNYQKSLQEVNIAITLDANYKPAIELLNQIQKLN